MNDTTKVSILHHSGPGFIPQEPLAIVAKLSDAERSALEAERVGQIGNNADRSENGPDTRYLYYQLFIDGCATPSKTTFDQEEPFVGRIVVDFIPPPHTTTSIKRSIARAEKSPALVSANLFADISCDTPMAEGHISILTGRCPGLTESEPMALVLANTPQVEERDTYTRKIKAKRRISPDDPTWLSYSQGDILYTNGVVRKEKHCVHGSNLYDVYSAKNEAGKIGFIFYW